MTQAHRPGEVEGWRRDPYGRHELRFFDGLRWTAYVRDGDENGTDDLSGPLPDVLVSSAARSRLLLEDVMVVERFTDLGRRWSDRAIHKSDGSVAGTLRRAATVQARPGSAGSRLSVPRDFTKNDVVELVDELDQVALTLIRPHAARTSVEVLDAEGGEAGRIVQQSLLHGQTTYAFLTANGHFLGDLQAENWVAWDLRVVDRNDRQVASISRDFAGLDPARFNRPDAYVVRINDSVLEPLRSLVVACALSLEVAVRPDARGL